MTDEEWNKEIIRLFGTNVVSLGNARFTPDECIGFARQLLTGEDPHRDERVSYGASNQQSDSLVLGRSGDTLPMMFIVHNVLSIPPSQRSLFWSSQQGKQTLSSILNSITESI